MKLFKLFLLMIAGLVSTSAIGASLFTPELNPDGTYEEVDFFYVSVPAGYTLGVFDSADTTYSTALLVNTGEEVAFTPNTPASGPYTATNTTTSLSIPVSTVGQPEFMLALYDGSSWLMDTGASALNAEGTAYSVTFENTFGEVFSVDVRLVPVPAAVWLFGSGLFGLIAVARRRV